MHPTFKGLTLTVIRKNLWTWPPRRNFWRIKIYTCL